MSRSKYSTKKKRSPLYLLLIPCILACTVTLAVSLYLMFPFTASDVLRLASEAHTCLSQQIASLADIAVSWQTTAPSHTSANSSPAQESEDNSSAPYIETTGEQGEISNLQSESSEPEDQVYLYMLDTSAGPMLYYHQGDIRWGDYLYGGYDPMSSYGCGPTAAAMVINSFTDQTVDPTDIADWAAENGYYALHSGSYHSLIPDVLSAHGLYAESVTDRSREHVTELLSSGHILIALMGRGALTQNGHFVLFTQLLDNGHILIADPVNYENCTLEWDLDQLLSELKKSYDSGGPLWAIQL